ncbi:transcription elongation factor GreAB [Sphingopyxis lindanitolerans]|uniref:Transcription elongation factor GreAB n=1 Tax=Sphingopyxis lindanitolerans TaxID=2054227 RepID=A0A2S8B422_9SPHN|nr:nucleoside diphosphate kinase regulator [Sphingopyxis lindanitolerans]PQM27066.1 transcription elongation factor GreAB [Sphingopyxis lindanitolerans]
MTTPRKPRRRPSIHMIDSEADALADLAVSVEKRMPQVSALLTDEISRATVHSAKDMPRDVVTMSSQVEFIDEANGEARTIQLVYPHEADIAAGRVSILTPVGAGLIGLRQGQSIRWPDRDGHERALSVVGVIQPAAATN